MIVNAFLSLTGINHISAGFGNLYRNEYRNAAVNFSEGVARGTLCVIAIAALSSHTDRIAAADRQMYSEFIKALDPLSTTKEFCSRLAQGSEISMPECIKTVFNQLPDEIFNKIMKRPGSGANIARYCVETLKETGLQRRLTSHDLEVCVNALFTKNLQALSRLVN